MSKEQHADSTPDEKASKRRKLSADSVLVEAARNGDTTAVRVGLEKLNPDTDTDSKTVAFDAVHEACRGNHDECLALLLPYVETTQMGFGMLLSKCIHADHTACTEVLLQHWKSVCSNVAFVPHGCNTKGNKLRPCPAMWADPAVCQVLIDAGADIEVKDEDGRSPLLRASISGKPAVVKMLVEAGAGVRVTDNQGLTCLALASCFGRTETVRYLAGLKEVDVNYLGDEGFTALHWAGQKNHPEVVQVLIDAGADIEVKDEEGYSPLLRVSKSGALNVVKMLVEAGADVCVTDNKGRTCLIFAAHKGHTETVRYLVGLKDVDVNQSGDEVCSALRRAVVGNHADVVQVLIDAGADIETKDQKGRSPLHNAGSSGALDVLKTLVKAGADVCVTDSTGRTCLIFAAHRGHTETVRYLVGLKDVDVNHVDTTGWPALRHAAVRNHPDVVQVLIDAGADIETRDNHDRTPLLVASQCGNLRVVKVLVKAGADVCVTDNKGLTCLTLAAGLGHSETVRTLLCLPEVDVNQSHNRGFTSLHCAVLKKHSDVVQLLIDAGADIEVNRDRISPLRCACDVGELDIVQMLVEAGAGVRATDNEGNTCLILAAQKGHTETVRYLVGLPEVDVNHRNVSGLTALQHASHKQHADVVQILSLI